jgi:hypothetical protein
LHHDDALWLHVDHSFERLGQLPVPLGDLGPDGVAQLVLRVRSHGDFAVLVGKQEPEHEPRLQRGLANTVSRPDRYAVVLAYSFKGFRLPTVLALRREPQ